MEYIISILILLFLVSLAVVRETRRAELKRMVRQLLARHFDNVGLAIALVVLSLVALATYSLDAEAGRLRLDTLQLVALPAVLLFVILHTSIWCYKHFLRPWFQYLKADAPKLFADVMPPLEDFLTHIPVRQQTIYYHTLFRIRCVRTVFSLVPLFVLLYLLVRLMEVSLALVPR